MRPVFAVLLLGGIVQAQESKGFALKSRIELANVDGRIDHFSVDVKGQRLFMAALGNHTIEVMDIQNGKRLHTIPDLAEPQGLYFDPTSNHLFAGCAKDGTTKVFDGSTFQLLETAQFSSNVDNVRYDARNRRIIVGYGAGGLGFLDMNGKKIGEIPLDAHPESFRLEKSGTRVFVNVPNQKEIQIRGRDLSETFEVGGVKVAANGASAERPAEPKEETINFTKEQQWALDFGTQLATERPMRDVLRVAAETLPRTGGEAVVIAPVAGRIVSDKTLAVGTGVQRGIELTAIVPPAAAIADPASLHLAETEAKVALEQAQRDRARADRLLAAGAVPARRVEDARALEATAQARLQAAQDRLAQYNETRSAEGTDGIGRRFVVRAPINGVLSESSAISGANVEAGTALFRIVDTNRLYVSGVVPESEFSKLHQLSGAEVEVSDAGQIRPVSRLVAIGQVVDEKTRTVPVTYEIDDGDHRLAVNQTVFLRLLLSGAGNSPVIPETAIIVDAGRPVVFVQSAGESFVRRPVKLGVRNGGVAQVLEGVSAGDRVVTKGAQPISHRIDHMLSGTLANIAVKIFGDDLHELRRLGKEVQAAMIGVPGVVDLSLEQQTEIPTLRIKPDPASGRSIRIGGRRGSGAN